MIKRIKNRSEKPARPGEMLHKGRSPFSAKSVWAAISVLIGGGGAMAAGTSNNALAAWLQGQAPAVMTIAGSYLGGFFIGWGARRTIKLTSIIAGIALALIGLLVSLGWDGSAVQSWVNSSSAWASESIEGAGRDLIALLPSASAAGAGGVLGFRRK